LFPIIKFLSLFYIELVKIFNLFGKLLRGFCKDFSQSPIAVILIEFIESREYILMLHPYQFWDLAVRLALFSLELE